MHATTHTRKNTRITDTQNKKKDRKAERPNKGQNKRHADKET